MLYRSTARLCRAGAAMYNRFHNFPLLMVTEIVPSKTGTEHLVLVNPFRQGDSNHCSFVNCALDFHPAFHRFN